MSTDSTPQVEPAVSRQRPVTAIDGPAGAGKSTLAAHLARKFGFLNLETGAMYRALAYKAIDADLDLDAESEMLDLCRNTTIKLEPTRDGNRVLLDGMDVSRRVRDGDVTAAASRVSIHPRVREWMVAQQRALGEAGGVVMEGRDIGTAVFPDAEVKIFLDASPEVRGSRRYRQVASNEHEAVKVTESSLLAEMKARDERDRNRAQSPLKPAEDAVILDSTALSLDEVLAKSEEIVRAHITA